MDEGAMQPYIDEINEERRLYAENIAAAQHQLNGLLMGAYTRQLSCELKLNNPCCVERDERIMVGIVVKHHDMTLHNDDGVP